MSMAILASSPGQSLRALSEDLKLPKRSSLVIMLCSNLLLQISFFIVVPSSNDYAKYLGGDSTFAGLILGIPTLFSGLALLPMIKFDRGQYRRPLDLICAASIIGNIIYACAYRANFLYLLLLGRVVTGAAFTGFMYTKKYCTDSRLVGIRRRSTLASWQVLGQGIGMSAGPLIGGALTRIGSNNRVFNGFTSPAWLVAAFFAVFWLCIQFWFQDVHENGETDIAMRTSRNAEQTLSQEYQPATNETGDRSRLNALQIGCTICMCWCALMCFFILGAWEANLPVFGNDSALRWSPYQAGNFLAIGGFIAFPFLIANIFVVRRTQDRNILAGGTALGLAGILIFQSLLSTGKVSFGSFLACWSAVALGFNLASTVSVSLLSKQLPQHWNQRTSLYIQYANYTGRVTGAVWGGSGVRVGMSVYLGVQIAVIGIGAMLWMTLWRNLKAKTG